MRLGTLILPLERWVDAERSWREAEQIGLDVSYSADHLTHPAMPGIWWSDAWATLAGAAQITSTIQLGPLVAAAAVRNPATLARAAATLQDISGGRLVLGLGAGTAADAAADRGEAPSAADLATRYAEVVAAVRRIWAGESEVAGDHVRAEGLLFQPLPTGLPAPPLLLAAHGPRGIDLVARVGDGWSTFGGHAAAALSGEALWRLLREQSRLLDVACERAGRDPAEITRSLLLGHGAEKPLASVGAFLDAAGRAESEGFDELVVYWPVGAPGGRFWSDPQVLADGVAQLRR